MKPPICEVCGERFEPDEGGLVRFLPEQSDDTVAAPPIPSARNEPEMTGHPPDQEWFCGRHVEAARTAAVSMTLAEARRHLSSEPG